MGYEIISSFFFFLYIGMWSEYINVFKNKREIDK